MKKILPLLFCCLCSCTVNHGTYTVISNQIVDLDNLDLEKCPKIRNVEGESVGHIAIFIPIGEMNPNVESAMVDAFKNSDGDLFTNASLHSMFFWIPYIYGQVSFTINGDIVKTRK